MTLFGTDVTQVFGGLTIVGHGSGFGFMEEYSNHSQVTDYIFLNNQIGILIIISAWSATS